MGKAFVHKEFQVGDWHTWNKSLAGDGEERSEEVNVQILYTVTQLLNSHTLSLADRLYIRVLILMWDRKDGNYCTSKQPGYPLTLHSRIIRPTFNLLDSFHIKMAMRNGNGVGQRQVGQLLLCIPQACCVFWLSLCTYNGILRIVLLSVALGALSFCINCLRKRELAANLRPHKMSMGNAGDHSNNNR